MKRRPGIFVRSDAASNATLDKSAHPEKTPSPRFKTEEGTMKEVIREQPAKEKDPSL
jgi:hypothetical protein